MEMLIGFDSLGNVAYGLRDLYGQVFILAIPAGLDYCSVPAVESWVNRCGMLRTDGTEMLDRVLEMRRRQDQLCGGK